MLVRDIVIGAGSSDPANLTAVNGTLFFTADDGVNGVELWRSDGTTQGRPCARYRCDTERRFRSCQPHQRRTARCSSPPTMASMASNCGAAMGQRRGRPRCAISIPHRAPVPILPTSPTSTARCSSPPTMASTALNCGAATARYRERLSCRDIATASGAGSNPANLTDVNGVLYFAADDGAQRHRAVAQRWHRFRHGAPGERQRGVCRLEQFRTTHP